MGLVMGCSWIWSLIRGIDDIRDLGVRVAIVGLEHSDGVRRV